MSPKPDSPPEKTRRRLLLSAWALLALSLLLCLGGPWLSQGWIPAGIGNHRGDSALAGLGWNITGMIMGALALMCFVAQWVLRPGSDEGPQPQEPPQSKERTGAK